MPTNSQGCLSVNELAAHQRGELADSRLSHLESCMLCQAAADGYSIADDKTKTDLEKGIAMPSYEKAKQRSIPRKQPRKLSPRPWLIAASLLVGLGWAGWHYISITSANPSIPDSEWYAVEQPYRRQMRASTTEQDLYAEAAIAYEQARFGESIQQYKLALQNASTDLLRTRGFYELGIAQWKAGHYQDAADNLTRARLGELDYFEDATWALAQLYRQMGRLDEAKVLYNDLLRIERSPYRPRAQSILQAISDTL
jgi:tetratricopeptide (TPR) repeat protein